MRPIRLANHRARREAERRNSLPCALPRAETIFVLDSYFQQVREALELLPTADVARVAEELLRVRAERKTAYILGNGGSAATAGHAATDWLKPNRRDSFGGVSAVSLVDNVALLTAWANDTSFDNVFAAQLESLVEPGDLVIAVSGSGNSPNVLRAVEAAREAGAVTVGFSGFDGGALGRMTDISVVVPCDSQGMIEDVHLVLVHALTVALRQAAEVSTGDGDAGEEEERVRSVAR
jgi:D-sedoheptulose 7-phosphate isomerase